MQNNIYIFQVQYAIEIRDTKNYYIPYSAGCVVSYAKQFKDITDKWNFGEIFFRREHPDAVLERLDNPKIVGFSNYVWNTQYHLAIAKMIKEKYPECLIIFGGPNTGKDDIDNGLCDSIVKAEGEQSFVQLLRDYENNDVKQVYTGERIQKLDSLPSPYLEGVFDSILEAHPDALFSATLETNRGCPFLCTFCDWGSLTYTKIKQFNLEKVAAELEWIKNNNIGYIFCADANFGVFRDRDIAIAKLLRETCEKGKVEAVNIQYYKNSNETAVDIAEIMGPYSRGVTLSLQSNHGETLKAIKRDNMKSNNFVELLELINKRNVSGYSEFILPMPEETVDTFKDGISTLLDHGQHNGLEVWSAQLLRNSEMSTPEYLEKYGIESITAVDYNYFGNPDDYTDIKEQITLVNKTNTMSTEQVNESFMFAWLIINFHQPGYSQLYAKYCRNVLGITYRQFYEKLLDIILKDDIMSKIYHYVKEYEYFYITNGRLPEEHEMENKTPSTTIDKNKYGGHFIANMLTYQFMWDNRKHAKNISKQAAESFGDIEDSIHTACDLFVYDFDQTFENQYVLPYDLESWKKEKTIYSIQPKEGIADMLNKSSGFLLRRHGAKNIFTKINT